MDTTMVMVLVLVCVCAVVVSSVIVAGGTGFYLYSVETSTTTTRGPTKSGTSTTPAPTTTTTTTTTPAPTTTTTTPAPTTTTTTTPVPTTTTTTTPAPTTTTTTTPAPVNAVVTEGSWTPATCPTVCGTAASTRTKTNTCVPARNGGTPCPVTLVHTETCPETVACKMIYNKVSGFCLDRGQGATDVAKFVPCDNNSQSQKWALNADKKYVNRNGKELGVGDYRTWINSNNKIKSFPDTNTCLSAPSTGGIPTSGNATTKICDHYNDMNFVDSAPSVVFSGKKLYNPATDRCLQMNDNSVTMNTCIDNNRQHWLFTSDGKLLNVGRGGCVVVTNGIPVSGSCGLSNFTRDTVTGQFKTVETEPKTLQVSNNASSTEITSLKDINGRQVFTETDKEINAISRSLGNKLRLEPTTGYLHRNSSGDLVKAGVFGSGQSWNFRNDGLPGPIMNSNNGTCISRTTDSNRAVLEACSGEPNQKWTFGADNMIKLASDTSICLNPKLNFIHASACPVANADNTWTVEGTNMSTTNAEARFAWNANPTNTNTNTSTQAAPGQVPGNSSSTQRAPIDESSTNAAPAVKISGAQVAAANTNTNTNSGHPMAN